MRNSKSKALRALCLLGVCIPLFFTAVAHAQQQTGAKTKFYRWVDDKGTVHYTERLPQEATGRATSTMSPQGTVLKETNRALTPEERAANEEAARKKEEALVLRQEEERKNLAVLSSYSSEKDIDAARERALQSNDDAVKNASHNVETATKRRAELKQQSAKYEGKPLPPFLVRELETNELDLKNQQQLLDMKKREGQQIATRYDEDKRRFLRLKTPQSPAPTTTAGVSPRP